MNQSLLNRILTGNQFVVAEKLGYIEGFCYSLEMRNLNPDYEDLINFYWAIFFRAEQIGLSVKQGASK